MTRKDALRGGRLLQALALFAWLLFPLCAAGEDTAIPPPATVAQTLFEGPEGPAVEVGARILRACRSCHGRDGAGGVEGNVPAVDALSAASPLRPGYDAAAFALAVTRGVGPDGRELSRLMPRYDLPVAVLDPLWSYLGTLRSRQRRGVGPAEFTLGVVAVPGRPGLAEDYAARLSVALGASLGPAGAYLRHPRIELLSGSPEAILARAEQDVLAIVGLSPGAPIQPDQALRRGVPVLLPLAPLDGDEDPTLARGLLPSWNDIARHLTTWLGEQGVDRLAIIAAGSEAHPLAEAFGRQTSAALTVTMLTATDPTEPEIPGAVLVLGLNRGATFAVPAGLERLIDRLPPGAPILIPATEAGRDLPATFADHPVRLIVEAPDLLETALHERRPALDAHARATAQVLAAAMNAAGRDLTRASLVRAFGSIRAAGLDYSAHPLTGTDRIEILD